MTIRLYGILTDGLNKPIVNATVSLIARSNTLATLGGSEAVFRTNAQGAYNITVNAGHYVVIVGPQGTEPYKAGEIVLYADSADGSLNGYLVDWVEEELTPDVIKQVQDLVATSQEFALQAERASASANADATDARNSKASAAQSASEALVYKNDSKANADAAKQAQAGAAGSANTANAAITTIQGIQREVTASKDRAVTAETNAKASQGASAASATSSANSASAAKSSQDAAKQSENKAKEYVDSIQPANFVVKSQNLADLPDKTTSRNNLSAMLDSKVGLDATTNLNSLNGTKAGFYYQPMSANAKPELNYPIALAGALLVIKTGANTGYSCKQVYSLYNNPNVTYSRVLNASTGPDAPWSEWRRHIFTERVEEGASATFMYSAYSPDAPRLQVGTTGLWGCHNGTNWVPLALAQGGTGATSVDVARTNLGLGRGDSPQLNSLFLDRTSDSTSNYTAGGMLHTRLLANDNTVRLAADMYVQTFPNEQGRLTIRFTSNGSTSTTKYLDFTSEGNLLVDSAILKSTVEKPLQINSANPAIRFNETDRPANTPTYTLAANAGDWFIQKRDYDDAGSVSNAIAYNFSEDRIYLQNLRASGLITAISGIATLSSNWSTQHTDNVDKFKPIAGNAGGPDGTMVVGGFHAQFSGNYATQFAGRNSSFWARSFEAGVDKGWKRLLTVNDLNSSTDLAVRSLATSNPVKSGGGRIDVLGSTSDYSKMDCFVRGLDSTGNSLAWALGSSVGVSKMLSLKNFFSGAEILLNGNDGAVQLKTGTVGGAAAQAITINKDEVYSTVNFAITKGGKRFSIENSANSELPFNMRVWGSSTRQNVFEVGTSAAYLFYAQKTSKGQLFDVNGNINCVTLNQSSDRRLKENINVIADATGAIRKINGYTYTLKDGGSNKAGVIAQEVMEALPEAVGSFIRYGEELPGPTEDGNTLREEASYLNVDYSALTGLLVQFSREADDRISKLETEVEELKKLVTALVNKDQPLP